MDKLTATGGPKEAKGRHLPTDSSSTRAVGVMGKNYIIIPASDG